MALRLGTYGDLGVVGVSYERGTLVATPEANAAMARLAFILQGYLTHRKHLPPQTLQ